MAQSRRELASGGLLTKLEDLDFADDIVLITRSPLPQKSVGINKLAEAVGLKINIGKT